MIEADRANAEIRIYSLDGRLLLTGKTSAQGSCRLSVSTLTAGEDVLTIEHEHTKLIIE